MAEGIGIMTFDDDLADDGFNNGQVDDIFGDDDDIFNAPAPLPPLSPTNLTGDANDGEQTGEQDGDQKPKKKVIKRSPQPRLDDRRLCSDRGIPALKKLCDGVKFKGKGHEASDLNVLIQRFEHWSHRLFPKFTFEDCVDQIEAISGKKLVQNTIQALRRGDPDDINDDSDQELLMDADKQANQAESSLMDNPTFGGQINVEASSVPVPQPDLTEEEKERIRQNRERALAKRKQRQQSEAALQNATIENQDATPSKSPSKNSENPSNEDSGIDSQSPERAKLSFDNETKETENESLETGEGQMETIETGSSDNETMVTGESRQETMVTNAVENNTTTTGENQNDSLATGVTQKEGIETTFTQNETMETEVTMTTGDEEEALLADINANTVNNEAMETIITPKKSMVTKNKEAGNQDALATEVSENGVDNNENIITENGDCVGMNTESARASKENDNSVETANVDFVAMET